MSDADAASEPSLYAGREPIFPKSVKGTFRRLKWWIMGLCLAVYYITPWIRWDRGPNLPDQAVLIDLGNRRFYFFWIEIWPQEFYYIAGLLIMAGLGLFLFTSVLGRVWCGYACPQTVWVDVYQHVERLIEGDRNAQIRLHRAPWSGKKIRLRAFKYLSFFLIALATGGAWVFYFADAPTLLVDLVTGDAAAVAYWTILVLTGTTFLLGGFAREQVCIYMCPWPRIQGAMLDENSLIVTYKDWRGEPRGKHRRRPQNTQIAAEVAEPQVGGRAPVIAMPGMTARGPAPAPKQELGDCIDCNACVNVCPTGVDIREGQQIGCITCALCIDACDEMMAKVGKPRGLIDYCTLNDEALERQGLPSLPVLKRVIRPRTIVYFTLWALIGVGMLVALVLRDRMDISVAPIRNPVFVTLSDGSVRNAYDLRIRNMEGVATQFVIGAESSLPVDLAVEGIEGALVTVPADSTQRIRMYLTVPPGVASDERTPVTITVEQIGAQARSVVTTTFQGPGQ